MTGCIECMMWEWVNLKGVHTVEEREQALAEVHRDHPQDIERVYEIEEAYEAEERDLGDVPL